ncbi:hypothetical protein M139_4859 [Bacteroides fragilis str. S23L24]|nr:hypothetical protein M139_4859 [Bacteroides fragilis str. S23L24]
MLDILSFYFVGHFSDSLLSNFLGSVHPAGSILTEKPCIP